MEDASFYWSHRTLHTPYFFSKIHKVHHEYYNSISIAAIYAHPLEYLFGNIVPTALGFTLLGSRTHFATVLMWLSIRTFETIDGHCGYEFSWSPYRLLPLSTSSEYHNYHHMYVEGTYSSFFSFWDSLCKTNSKYFEFKAKKERIFEESILNKMRKEFENKLVKKEK